MAVDTVMAHVELPAARTSARDARAFINRTLAEWRVAEEWADTACLLATELVTNAVLFAGTPIDLVLESSPETLRVQVLDHTHQLPMARPTRDPMSMTGRGLLLVKDLAASWGVTTRDDGKSVWFELSAPGPR